MEGYLIKGMLIGILFGMPAGVVGAMTIQRTLKHGIKAGLVTGLGSSVADCFYACIGAFGLTVLSDFLLHHQMVINILGGMFIFIMGIQLFTRNNEEVKSQNQATNGIKMFLTSFAVGITNPAAILTFLFAFSYFEIGEIEWFNGIQLVIGVFIGTYIWWSLLSMGVSFIKKKTKTYHFHYMNKVFGTILIVFSIIVFIKIF